MWFLKLLSLDWAYRRLSEEASAIKYTTIQGSWVGFLISSRPTTSSIHLEPKRFHGWLKWFLCGNDKTTKSCLSNWLPRDLVKVECVARPATSSFILILYLLIRCFPSSRSITCIRQHQLHFFLKTRISGMKTILCVFVTMVVVSEQEIGRPLQRLSRAPNDELTSKAATLKGLLQIFS